MKEKCLSEAKLKLSFKYFVNFRFFLKLFSKYESSRHLVEL